MSSGDFKVRTILFLQKPDFLHDHVEIVRGRLAGGDRRVTVFAAATPEDVPLGLAVDAVICPTLPWLPEALERLESVQWIHFLSAGVDSIWEMSFDKERMLLTKSSGVHGSTMAEYALGALLYFFKSFDRYVEQSSKRMWQRHWMDAVSGKTVMILGAGRIGREVASRCRAFGMEVVGVQRQPASDAAAYLPVDLEGATNMLGEMDALIVTVPLTDETRGLVDARMMRALKRGAIVVDISRGGVVDHAALLALIEEGHLRGAAIDVFDIEPLDASSPLWGRREILLTPHVSGTTPTYMERAMDIFMDNLDALSAGRPATTPVDIGAKY